MRSRCRPSRPERTPAAAALGLVALVALATSCSSSDPGDAAPAGHGEHAGAATAVADINGAPDRAIAGPQGRVPQFVVECPFSHAATDDPIVHPGKPGNSHLHVFFGNESTDAFSTLASLDAAGTTCDQPLDRAAYWAPALLDDGELVPPVQGTAYYRPGIDVDPATVEPYPPGLAMVAGNAFATSPQSTAVVAWSCGAGIERAVSPPSCPAERGLRMLVTFPDCWDGRHLDSESHVDHVAYSAGGACPSSHPVPIPQLQFAIQYPISGRHELLELASGGLLTGHADFLDAWDPARLEREVRQCLHRAVVCGVTSGKVSG